MKLKNYCVVQEESVAEGVEEDLFGALRNSLWTLSNAVGMLRNKQVMEEVAI